jgi:hypothetical protein
MDSLFALLILASLVLLIIGFFNPNASLFWYNKEKTRTTSSIIYGIALIASFILFGITTDTSKTSTKSNNAGSTENEAVEEETKEKTWQPVYTFKGNGMKKSPTFELTGGEARLKYKYNSDNGMGMGMFAAYVVDEGKDIMKQGGIPEVMTSAENEESESSIQKSAGRYYLNINATGNWTVTVEEFK